MKTDLRFVHIGMGNIVQANAVLAMIHPRTQNGKRWMKNAKDKKIYIDCCLGRKAKALLILEDGRIIGSAIKPKTLAKRFNGENAPDELDKYDDIEDDDGDFDEEAVEEVVDDEGLD